MNPRSIHTVCDRTDHRYKLLNEFRQFTSERIVLRATLPRLAAGLMGPLLLGLGAGISVSIGMGALGFALLLDALHLMFSLPFWLSQTLMTLLFFYIAWKWARIPLGPGSLPAVLLIGPAISLGATVAPDALNIATQVLTVFAGLFLFSFGISLSAAAALGPDAITALSLATEKRWHWPVPRSNFVWNVSAIVSGCLLGGRLGPVTIAGLIVTPLFITLFLPKLKKLLR